MWGLRCYVGEVFVRNAHAEWKDDELPEVARSTGTVWLACGEAWLSPIGTVVKRVALGEGQDLPAFYSRYVTQREVVCGRRRADAILRLRDLR